MNYDDDNAVYVLSSGKTIPAYNGVLGISPSENDHDSVYGGYDNCSTITDFTAEERCEVARFVSELWMKWANA